MYAMIFRRAFMTVSSMAQILRKRQPTVPTLQMMVCRNNRISTTQLISLSPWTCEPFPRVNTRLRRLTVVAVDGGFLHYEEGVFGLANVFSGVAGDGDDVG